MMLPLDSTDTNGGLPPDEVSALRGLKVVARLKERGVDLKRVLIVTAFGREEAIQHLMGMGVAAENIMLKPVRTVELLSRIRAICRIV